MISKDYKFPYNIGDAVGLGAKWVADILSMTFCRYYTDETDPNVIEVRFHGVDWMRTTCLNQYPCPDEEWEIIGYDPDKTIDEYLLIERKWFNDDYEEFMIGNGFGLNTVRCLDDNIVFIDDRLIFSCTQIEIVSAFATLDLEAVESKLPNKYRDDPKYNN